MLTPARQRFRSSPLSISRYINIKRFEVDYHDYLFPKFQSDRAMRIDRVSWNRKRSHNSVKVDSRTLRARSLIPLSIDFSTTRTIWHNDLTDDGIRWYILLGINSLSKSSSGILSKCQKCRLILSFRFMEVYSEMQLPKYFICLTSSEKLLDLKYYLHL